MDIRLYCKTLKHFFYVGETTMAVWSYILITVSVNIAIAKSYNCGETLTCKYGTSVCFGICEIVNKFGVEILCADTFYGDGGCDGAFTKIASACSAIKAELTADVCQSSGSPNLRSIRSKLGSLINNDIRGLTKDQLS